MYTPVRLKQVKELDFQRPDGKKIPLAIPSDLNQSLLRNAVFKDYLIFKMTVGREIAEAEICQVKRDGDVVGFLIPGQAVLSTECAKNSDRLFGTYSLMVALAICIEAQSNSYNLANNKYAQAESKKDIFISGSFYAIIWIKPLGIPASAFLNNYFVSLAKNGIYPVSDDNMAIRSSRTFDSYNTSITIKKNRIWPAHIETILMRLAPFADNAFLRFFYLYQVIETLMTENYSNRLSIIRNRFDCAGDISITQLKGFVNDFQDIVKEEPRIKNALQPACTQTNLISEKILTALKEDFNELDFGQRIYKIRNIIFHDFQRIHHLSDDVLALEDNLSSYLLTEKLF